VLDEQLLTEAVDTALDLHAGEATKDPLPALEAEMRRVTQERDRYVAAVGSGGSIDALVEALRQREATLQGLEARRAVLRTQRRQAPAIDRARVRRELLSLAANWRHVLTGDAEHARPIVTMLLDGRVTFKPAGAKRWELHGTGTLSGLFQREVFL
jgi:hypothetical protein